MPKNLLNGEPWSPEAARKESAAFWVGFTPPPWAMSSVEPDDAQEPWEDTQSEVTFLDKRHLPRASVSWRARLLQADGSMIESRTVDSSSGGCGLISPTPTLLDEAVHVALQTIDDATGALSVVVRKGRVVSVNPGPQGYRIGVRCAL